MKNSNPAQLNVGTLSAEIPVGDAPRRAPGRKTFVWVIILLVIAIGYSTVYRAGPYRIGGRTWGSLIHRCDLSVFVSAGRAALKGTEIYEARNMRGWRYVYPPPFALLMMPFAVIPLIWASLIWYLLSVTAIVFSVRLTWALLATVHCHSGNLRWLALLPSALVLWLLISALQHGQTTPLVLWLVMTALACERSGRNVCGGIALAAAILIKVFPALLIAYFVWRRKWRVVGITIIAMFMGGFILPSLIYGARRNLTYWNEWIGIVALPAVSSQSDVESNPLGRTLLSPSLLNNQSLSAVLWRIKGGAQSSRMIALAILAAMAIITWLAGRRTQPDCDLALLSSFIAWMVLVPPVSWAHYFMLLLLPLTVLVFLLRQEQDWVTRLVMASSLVIFGICCSISPIPHWQFWGSLCWGTIVLWFALVIMMVRRSPLSV
jgi:hypothetical protein